MNCQVSVFSVRHRRRSIPRFKDQQHLDAIVNEAQRILPYGIGDVGPTAVKWIDKLSETGQSWWQALQGRGDGAVELWNLINRSTMPRRLRKCSITKLSRMGLVPTCMESRRTRAAA